MTGAQLTRVWSEALFGECDLSVLKLGRERTCDLYLLTNVDVPWVRDAVRYLPDERASFFDRCRSLLRELGVRYAVLEGSREERERAAIAEVRALLAQRP